MMRLYKAGTLTSDVYVFARDTEILINSILLHSAQTEYIHMHTHIHTYLYTRTHQDVQVGPVDLSDVDPNSLLGGPFVCLLGRPTGQPTACHLAGRLNDASDDTIRHHLKHESVYVRP